jgi:hypothetical protein
MVARARQLCTDYGWQWPSCVYRTEAGPRRTVLSHG